MFNLSQIGKSSCIIECTRPSSNALFANANIRMCAYLRTEIATWKKTRTTPKYWRFSDVCTSDLRRKIYLCAKIWPFYTYVWSFSLNKPKQKSLVQLWFGSSFLRFISTKSSELCKYVFVSVLVVRLLIGYVLVTIYKQYT